GIALVFADSTIPEELEDAIFQKAPRLIANPVGSPKGTPAETLAAVFRTVPRLEDLLSDTLDDQCAVLRFETIPISSRAQWALFLQRFAKRRAGQDHGIHILVPDLPNGIEVAECEVVSSWRTVLRRGDRVIWAEEHLPNSRGGVAEELAVALATEVCRWRLDLAAALARAGFDDLSDPMAWLERCDRDPDKQPTNDGNDDDHCPLALLRDEKVDVVTARVWRAQLISLFPLLEEERQRFVDRYRKMLRVDDHARRLGVESVEELELGALVWQLSRRLDRKEADRLVALSRVRNALAHRKPALSDDVRLLLERSSSVVR
ncbi:MAG: hypothetical protein V7695_17860, partial [Sulfitobacter sp.]